MNTDALNPHSLARARWKPFAMAGATLPFVALFCFLSIQEPMCAGDCGGYVLLMGMAPWQKSYWRSLHFSFRGWTVPVFFSAFGHYSAASAQVIVVAQSLLLLAGTVVFAAAVASRLARGRRWWGGAILATMLAFQQGYFLFSGFLLSDSLAWTSLLFLLALAVAFTTLLKRLGYFRYAALYLSVGWMAIGARDANQQLFLILTVYLLLTHHVRLTWRQVSGLGAGVLFLCALQAHWAQKRYRVNMENVLIGRILPVLRRASSS